MNKKLKSLVGLCTCLAFAVCIVPASAQMSEVKEKPPMYSYVALWTIPRAQWGEIEKTVAGDRAILEKALANGTLVGYGNDETLVHQEDGPTHDSWWSSMSMAGLMNVLNQFYVNGTATSPALASATKHSDEIFVSRYYNWRSGTVKDGYVYVAAYKLKADAPDDAVDILSKNLIVPLLEKMLADGTVAEYEIDTQAVHTEAPGEFVVVYLMPNADGLDKVNAAIQATLKASPLSGPAFGSMVDSSAHRDELVRANATFK